MRLSGALVQTLARVSCGSLSEMPLRAIERNDFPRDIMFIGTKIRCDRFPLSRPFRGLLSLFAVLLLALSVWKAPALRAAPENAKSSKAGRSRVERSSAGKSRGKGSAISRSAKGMRHGNARASSTRWTASSAVPAPLRNHPQSVIFAAALGVLVLAVVLIAATRPAPVVVKEEASNESEEVARLRAMLEFERARQKEHQEMTWTMTMGATDAQYVMHPGTGTIDWLGPFDSLLGFPRNAFPRTIEAWAENIHPEESEGIIALYADSCRGQCEFKVEYRMRHRNGSYREWSQRGRPIFDDNRNLLYFVGACTDVTERNLLQNKLRQSEENLQRLLETSPDSSVSVNTTDVSDHQEQAVIADSAAKSSPIAESLPRAEGDQSVGDQSVGETQKVGSQAAVEIESAPLLALEMPLAPVMDVPVMDAKEDVDEIEYSIEPESGKNTLAPVHFAPLQDDKGWVGSAILSLSYATSRKTPEDESVRQAILDPLTGLASRVLFRDRLRYALANAERLKTPVALLSLNLDDFRLANDKLGPAVGDELLKVTAQRISQTLRTCDTAARLSGDEFAIVLENTHGALDLPLFANRVLEALLQPICINNENVFAPASIGVALSVAGCTPDELLSWAGRALDQAKKNGKGRYAMYEPVGEIRQPQVPLREAATQVAPEAQQQPTPASSQADAPDWETLDPALQLLMAARQARRNIRHDAASVYVTDGAIGGGVSGVGLANGFVIGDIAGIAAPHLEMEDRELLAGDLADDEAA